MDLMPILSTLRRHKTAAGLIVVEVAITCAIVCNALQLISTRLDLLNQDSGLPESELVVVDIRGTGGPANADEVTARDLQALRALSGVKAATAVNQVIYGDGSSNSGVSLEAASKTTALHASHYTGGEQTLATMGLKLVAGRDFAAEEYQWQSAVDEAAKPKVGQVIVNRAIAARLWPNGSALGQTLYVYGDTPSVVVGVVERLTHPYPGRNTNPEGYAMLFPVRQSFRNGGYLIRVEPSQRDAVMKAIPGVIEKVDNTRIVAGVKPLTEMREAYFAQDRSMVWLMGGVCVAMLAITAFGIVGLASFWVQQRTRMIGTRRALGASRRHILNYFQTENFLLTGIGIGLGMIGAYGINQLLMTQYELPRLPWAVLPAGALVLWVLGQIAVLGPALRAAALPPMAVMRAA
jgi:putative ABC transport system permease protein